MLERNWYFGGIVNIKMYIINTTEKLLQERRNSKFYLLVEFTSNYMVPIHQILFKFRNK